MNGLRYFGKLTGLTAGKLCQQRWLLAGLALLCFLLPLGAGRAAETALSRGVDFHGVTLAVTAPEGDGTPRQLERFMEELEDVAQYCRFVALDEKEAMEALENGEVTAVLLLPENFIRGVMWGENPDLRLIVPANRPLESLLLLWVGQSASDILSAFQSGVYAVLERYEANPPPGLDRDQVVFDINLRYISLALNRSGMFRTETVSATQTLPVSLHYALSLTVFFALAAAPVFVPLYGGNWLRFQRRLRAAGRGAVWGYFSAQAAGTPVLLLLLLPALLLAGGGKPSPALLGAALVMALFCCAFCSLCCLLTGSAGGCGLLSFGIALASLGLAGGIVPPVLLPAPIRRLSGLSPVTWLRQLAAGAMGVCQIPASAWIGLVLTGAGMTILALYLYRRRMDGEEETV